MIICSREEANKLLGEESNLLRTDDRNKDIVREFIDYETKEIKHGRGSGTLNLDDERRKEIATLALTSGLSNDEVASLTGVSHDSVSAYKHGATSESTYNEKDEVLNTHVNGIKTRATEAAQNKLMMAIEAITGEKIEAAKVRDIAGIAKDMSAVIKNMAPDNPNGGINNNVKVLIYQPRVREESDFEVITVNE
jgi:predicted transcriptional regulator